MDDLNENEPRAGILSEEIAAMHPGERFQLMFNQELEMSEQNELLEAAETLLGIIYGDPRFLTINGMFKANQAREIIAKHRPKPERLGGWMNQYPDGTFGQELYPTEEKARIKGSQSVPVHLREVVPVEFERWTAYEGPGQIQIQGGKRIRHYDMSAICDAHNAEMERIANA
jgi:hypothetical protein